MKNYLLLALSGLLPWSLFAQLPMGAELYKQFCVECHGARLEGNQAGPLIKENWLYGRDRIRMIRSMTHGIPNTTMIAWGTVLNKEQIESLYDFIVAAQTTQIDTFKPIPERLETEEYDLKLKVLVDDQLNTPWSIEFVDENRALVTEKPGRLRWLVNGKLDPRPIDGLPQIYYRGGLMDIALDPNYERNGWIYLAHGHAIDHPDNAQARSMTRIIRGKIEGHEWKRSQVIFQVPEDRYHSGGNRWGGRLLLDDRYLYFSIGDMARGDASQDPTKPNGKTYRIHHDGSIPKDNPFLKVERAIEAVYSLGNRNVQGFSFHPVTGEIWMTEHGPMGGDELNILKNGNNYGWPVITYGKDYSGEVVSLLTHKEGMEQPVTQWTPSIAVCATEFNTSHLFPKWKNNLFVGALAYEELRRLVIEDNEVVHQEVLFKGYGRVRDQKIGPDGALYVILNLPGSIVRITPDN